MLIYAQILGGVVINIIKILNGVDTAPFLVGFDFLVDVTSTSPQPGPGWTYDGNNFSAPLVIAPQAKRSISGFKLDTAGSQPSANSENRGLIWLAYGAVGAADILQVCTKNLDGSYSWKTVTML